MNLALDLYDIAFIGHVCFDEVIPYQGAPRVAPGSAVTVRRAGGGARGQKSGSGHQNGSKGSKYP